MDLYNVMAKYHKKGSDMHDRRPYQIGLEGWLHMDQANDNLMDCNGGQFEHLTK